MSDTHSSSSFLSILVRGFLEPFRQKQLALNYIGIFIGAFGFAGMMTYFSYDFAKNGAFFVGFFFIVRFLFANILLIPICFYGFYKLPLKTTYFLVVIIQIMASLYVFLRPSFLAEVSLEASVIAALIFSLMSVPFWSCFHINMLLYTSDENMGNEVSVSTLFSFIGSMCGTLFSGIALTYFAGVYTLLGLFCCLIGASVITASINWQKDISFLKRRPFSLWGAAKSKKMQLAATAQEGVFQFLIGFFAPVWMWVLGIKSVTMGLLLSVQGVIKLCLSPIAGHLFHENKSRDIVLGASIKPFGWLPWIFIQAPWVMLISSSIWTVGMHLYSVGLGSRWYSQRCLASQSVREMALGVGRIICTLIAVPLLYNYGPHSFFIFAFFMTGLTSVTALYFRRHEQNRRTIVPDNSETRVI